MTPEQALQLLTNAAALANLPLQAHIKCEEATDVLTKAIAKEHKDNPETPST